MFSFSDEVADTAERLLQERCPGQEFTEQEVDEIREKAKGIGVLFCIDEEKAKDALQVAIGNAYEMECGEQHKPRVSTYLQLIREALSVVAEQRIEQR